MCFVLVMLFSFISLCQVQRCIRQFRVKYILNTHKYDKRVVTSVLFHYAALRHCNMQLAALILCVYLVFPCMLIDQSGSSLFFRGTCEIK